MSGQKFTLFLFVFLLLASQIFVVAGASGVSKDVAELALTEAEETIASAYQTTLKAEETGANVSHLLIQLNEAENLLAQARMMYKQGDYEKAASFATLSEDDGKQVQSKALELMNSTISESLQRLSFTMLGSIVSVVSIVLGGIWIWRVFRRRYFRRVLGTKDV